MALLIREILVEHHNALAAAERAKLAAGGDNDDDDDNDNNDKDPDGDNGAVSSGDADAPAAAQRDPFAFVGTHWDLSGRDLAGAAWTPSCSHFTRDRCALSARGQTSASDIDQSGQQRLARHSAVGAALSSLAAAAAGPQRDRGHSKQVGFCAALALG